MFTRRTSTHDSPAEGLGRDALLIAADLDDDFGQKCSVCQLRPKGWRPRRLRPPWPASCRSVQVCRQSRTKLFPRGNNDTVRGSAYGAKTYGDLCNDRQTLGFVRLSRVISELGSEICSFGVSREYSAALAGFAASTLCRKLRRSTRGALLQVMLYPTSNRVAAKDISRMRRASPTHTTTSRLHWETDRNLAVDWGRHQGRRQKPGCAFTRPACPCAAGHSNGRSLYRLGRWTQSLPTRRTTT